MSETDDVTRSEEPDVTTRDLAERTSDAAAGSPDGADTQSAPEPLLPSEQGERYRSDWETIQARFVDEPRSSVESADKLVADLMQRLATSFSEERARLEHQWDSGDDVSTEDLRVTLTRYRSFFERLLTA